MAWLETAFPARGDAAVRRCGLCSTLAVAGFPPSGAGAGSARRRDGDAGVVLNLLPAVFPARRYHRQSLRPSASSALVTSGIYRRTRNPMYLGQALVLLGAMVYLQNLIALLVVPLFLVYITRLQILPEERALMARFPEAYAQYRHRVPRWL